MTKLPDGLDRFLASTDWHGAQVEPLTADASFRRYFRLRTADDTAMLMHAPPPHEDPRPFLAAARWLHENGLRAPEILSDDIRGGWVLLEDFGDERVLERLNASPREEDVVYAKAVDTLIDLQKVEPGPFARYDLSTYLREVDLLPEWWSSAMNLDVDRQGWTSAWQQVLGPLSERQEPGVTVLRDYHAENIMLLPDGSQGLIDFQDALVGHPAYDLVSLLQDARREVPEAIERRMLDRYCASINAGDQFEQDYAILGAQRNAKIVGIFTRLSRRDEKHRYLSLIPHVWRMLERDLREPALSPVADWFDANVPADLRERGGALA